VCGTLPVTTLPAGQLLNNSALPVLIHATLSKVFRSTFEKGPTDGCQKSSPRPL